MSPTLRLLVQIKTRILNDSCNLSMPHKNPKAYREYQRRYRKEHPEMSRDYSRQRNWQSRGLDMTTEGFDALFEAQNGLCAICKRESNGVGRLHVDHDHTTMRIRGLLCYSCNKALGLFQDDVTVVEEALRYLERFV